ncbi:PAPA-1-like conserved region-domain-containing protein [Dichotomocladium elegans]|nr:PAPA-1-like conserved region-domain-containing protein [Dichotomocladium elegans]
MRRGRNQPSPSISSIDSQEELSSGDDMEDELDDTLNPDVDELDDDLDDDLDNMIEDTLDVQSPSPEDTRKRSNKRKKPVYEEFGSDDEEEDYEVVTNRPMTKRQRAKMNNEGPEEFLELPMDTGKKKNILTQEEQTLRRSEVARRRKNQSIQRAEKDKEDTINRLLKKQASKSRKIIKDDGTDEKDGKTSSRPTQPDSLRYTSTREGNLLMIPTTVKLEDVFGQIAREPRQKTIPICAVKGCGQTKKYTGIKSGKAACSLEHYKKVEVGGK